MEIKLIFSFSQFMAAREKYVVTLPGFTRTSGLPLAVAISATENGVVVPLWGDWRTTGGFPTLTMTAGAGGIRANTKIEAVVSRSNQIYLRTSGLPTVESRQYWRVANNSAVKEGWSLAEVVFYSDTVCKTRIPTPQPLDSLGSSGAGISDPMNCSAFVYNARVGNGTFCPYGYRRARFAEIASCKLTLCDVTARPQYLVGQGDGAYFLGAGHGCQVLRGTTSYSNAESICLPQTAAAYNAFDQQSNTSWLHFSDENAEVYVGMKFDTQVAVQCALVEQERFDGDWIVSSLALQSSVDGVEWATIFESAAVKGTNMLSRAKAAAGSDAFASITIASTGIRGPCKNVRIASKAIGAFFSSALTFGRPVAGSVSNITVAITPQMEIDIGEVITLKLNGFTGTMSESLDLLARYEAPVFNGSSYVFAEKFSYNPRSAAPPPLAPTCGNTSNVTGNCSAVLPEVLPLFNATWDPISHTLRIKCGAVIYAGHKLMVTLLDSNNLSLPATGIASSICGTGPTVGPLSDTLGDGSSAPCGTCEGCIGVNENTMTIAVNAKAGAILASPPTVVRSVQRIGTFFNTTISFSAFSDVVPVNITVEFAYNFDLVQGDKVYLHLPEFKGISTMNVPTFGIHGSALATSSWNAANGLVTITVTNSSIAALTRLQVVVPSAAHVILRSDGFIKNSPFLQISSNAVNGPVYPKAFDVSPAMGSFTTGEPSRMSYMPGEFKTDGSPYMEGRISALTVGFALNRDIAVGERIILGLTGFSREAGVVVNGFNASGYDTNFLTVDTNGVFSSFMTASWVESSQRLTLTASKHILADQRHVVLIPSTARLRLPKIGLQQNDQRLTIGTDAELGPNSGTPIAQTPSLNEVCGAECGAWAFTCGACKCGPCNDHDGFSVST